MILERNMHISEDDVQDDNVNEFSRLQEKPQENNIQSSHANEEQK